MLTGVIAYCVGATVGVSIKQGAARGRRRGARYNKALRRR